MNGESVKSVARELIDGASMLHGMKRNTIPEEGEKHEHILVTYVEQEGGIEVSVITLSRAHMSGDGAIPYAELGLLPRLDQLILRGTTAIHNAITKDIHAFQAAEVLAHLTGLTPLQVEKVAAGGPSGGDQLFRSMMEHLGDRLPPGAKARLEAALHKFNRKGDS